MPTIAQQLQELVNQKAALATNLTTKGVQASSSEKLNTLVPKVLNIPTGTDTSDANATASDILSGKTGYVNGVKITGNISSKAAQTYIPTTSNQTIAAGQYLSGAQTIAGDVNLIASNVKSGVTIFGVTGDSNVMDTTEPVSTTASSSNVQYGMSAYVNGVRIVGECVSMDGMTFTPGASDITVQGPKILQGNKTFTISGDANLLPQNIKEGVTIFGVLGTHASSGDESDATVTPGDMKSGVIAYNNGARVVGNAYTRNGQINAKADGYIDGSAHWLQAGFYNGIAFEAEPTLIASNVKRGVTIYGTTGTYGPVEEFILDTTSASSASDVYNDYGDDIIVYIRGDQFRTLNEIQDYSTTLKTQADIDRPSEYHPDPHWIYRTATTGGTAEENYGIMANNSSSNQDENAVYNTIWDFANISQTKRIMFLGKNKVHLDGTMTTFEYLATVRSYSSNGSLFVAFIQATDLAALKNKLDTDDFGTWQLLTFSPVMSGIAQEHAFYNFTPGDYYMVLGIEIDALTGFSLKKMGYYNI